MKRVALLGVAVAALLAAAPTLAADMPARISKAPPAVVAPVFNWTGFYIGAHVGWGWGDYEALGAGPTRTVLDPDGWLAGGQVGFNWQPAGSPLVLGVEADLAWANINDAGAFTVPVAYTAATEVERLASVRGRIGIAFDRALVYATAGWGWARNCASATFGGALFAACATHDGWTAGGGIEWAFAPNWSAKIEYLHYNLGSEPYVTPPFTSTVDVDVDTVKLGVNFRFGPWGGPVLR